MLGLAPSLLLVLLSLLHPPELLRATLTLLLLLLSLMQLLVLPLLPMMVMGKEFKCRMLSQEHSQSRAEKARAAASSRSPSDPEKCQQLCMVTHFSFIRIHCLLYVVTTELQLYTLER
jgi:hypothetical protein